MSPAYRAHQTKFRSLVQFYLREHRCMDVPCSALIAFTTPTGNMRPDGDNAIGAIFDALQPTWLKNDHLVKRCAYALFRDKDFSITVELRPL